MEVLRKITVKQGFLIFIITIIIGQTINYFQALPRFQIFLPLVIVSTWLVVWEIREFLNSFDRFRVMTASHQMKFINKDIKELLKSPWALPGLIVIGSLYVYLTIELEYIKINLMGLFCIAMLCVIMITAIIAQTYYVYFLIHLYRIYKCDDLKYNFYFPAKTNWMILVSQMGKRLNDGFFILGFIYTLLFLLNTPKDAVHIIPGCTGVLNCLEITTKNDMIFITGWVVIFLLIIFAFPIYYTIQKRLIQRIIEKMKSTTIQELNILLEQERAAKPSNISTEQEYFELMLKVHNSENYPIKNRLTISILASIASIAVHAIKIFESFL